MQRPTPAYDSAARRTGAQRTGAPRPAARFRRSRPRPRHADAGVATLFWLTILVLGGFAATCVALGVSNAPVAHLAEKRLQPGPLIPKLNRNRTDAPAAAPAHPQVEPSAPVSDLRHAASPMTVPAEAAPNRLPGVVVAEANTEPAVFFPRRESTFGESPMIRTWNTLALASLLAAPAAAPAGAPASELDAKAILSRLEDLRKTVDALSKKVEALPPKFDGKRLVADIERLENNLAGRIDKVSSELKTEANAIKQEQLKQKLELQGLKSLETKLKNLSDEVATLFEDLRKLRKQGFSEVPVAPPTSDKAGLDDIRTRLGAIEKVLAGLQPSPGINNRTSAFAPPVANLGRLVLVNERDEPMLFFVNGAEHRVDPHRTIPLPELAPGNVSYSVWADGWGWIRSPHTTMLRANETLRLIAR